MDYLNSIERVVDHVENHLKEELETEALSRVARFSQWHFQRIFALFVGDSLKEYVRKRRLTSAMLELSSGDRRIIDIALDYQFDSQEAFSRAFKAQFHLTPGECRRQGVRSILALSKPKITMEYLDHLYGGLTMKPQYVHLPETKIVGLGSRFISILSPEKNNFVVIPRLWQEYLSRATQIPGKKGQVSIGLCRCLTEQESKKHPDECYYLAGCAVEEFSKIPDGMTAEVVPAGNYAVFTHKGRIEKLEHTMNYIFGSWLPKSGKKLRAAPDLEIYDQRFYPDSDESEMDIYIPVE